MDVVDGHFRPTLSYQRLHTEQPLSDEELHDKLRRTVPNKQELQVLESFLIFNKWVHGCHWRALLMGLQACTQDQLLSTDQGRAFFPPGAQLFARGRVSQAAVWHVLCHWFRIPWVPH